MKKFFKLLIVCLCVIPCAIMFCACKKDNHVSVNIKGDYVTVAEEDRGAIISQLSDLGSDSNFTTGVEFYSFITFASEELNISFTMDGKMQGEGENFVASISAKISENGYSQKCKYYIKDNAIYIDINGYKVKQTFSSTESSNVANIVTVEQIENIISSLQNPNLAFCTKGNQVKYKFTASLDESDMPINYEIYFVYTNNKLSGLRYIVKSEGINMDMQMVGFNGKIDLPNLDDSYVFDPDYGMN